MSGPDPLQSGASLARGGIDLRGAGQVGGALLRLLDAAAIPVAAVHRRRGVERRPTPFDDVERPSVLVDATPPAFDGPAAEAWVAVLEATLRGGTPVVTCNKAPLAIAWARLAKAARDGGVPLAATGTVGGGTPVLPILRQVQARNGPAAIVSVAATLSGTLGVVLPRVKAGVSVDEAVAEAQAAGYCEPDARLDLDGTDAWAKACILHNSLWQAAAPVSLADRPAPLRLEPEGIRALDRPALVARLAPGRISLALEDWPAGAGAGGLLVRAQLREGSPVAITGAGAGPAATAQALLADVQAVLAGRLRPGIGP